MTMVAPVASHAQPRSVPGAIRGYNCCMITHTSGCTPQVLEVHDDGTFWTNGAAIVEPAWPTDVEQWRGLINAAAVKHDVPPALIAGVMAGESRGKPRAGSPVGALGLMQVMPQYFGGNAGGRLYDPATNIEEGVGFLAELQEKYGGNQLRMLAGYNAGSARCRASAQWGLVQNKGYISKCLGYANDAIVREFSPYRPSKVPLGASVPSGGAAAAVVFSIAAVAYVLADRQWRLTDRLVESISGAL